eukprot:5066845-Pyramimonas_sp.AAC.1
MARTRLRWRRRPSTSWRRTRGARRAARTPGGSAARRGGGALANPIILPPFRRPPSADFSILASLASLIPDLARPGSVASLARPNPPRLDRRSCRGRMEPGQ